MAVFTGGTPAQLTLYLYSIATIVVFLWGLKTISEVRSSPLSPPERVAGLTPFRRFRSTVPTPSSTPTSLRSTT